MGKPKDDLEQRERPERVVERTVEGIVICGMLGLELPARRGDKGNKREGKKTGRCKLLHDCQKFLSH